MNKTSGFTLIELLVSMFVGGIVLSAIMGLVLSSQKLYTTDTARANINQDIGIGLTALTNNVREAGERLTKDFPAIEVNGSSGNQVLTIRRNLLDSVLPVCQNVNGNADVVFIVKNTSSGTFPEACKNDAFDIGLCEWIKFRINKPEESCDNIKNPNNALKAVINDTNNKVSVYIYNPKTKNGEMFIYDREDGSNQKLHKQNSTNWQYDYNKDDNPRLYAIEELKYYLKDGKLMQQKDGGAEEPFLPGVTAFEITPKILNSSGNLEAVTGKFPSPSVTGQTWKDTQVLEIRVTAEATAGGKTMKRTYTSSFTPRNVFSADE